MRVITFVARAIAAAIAIAALFGAPSVAARAGDAPASGTPAVAARTAGARAAGVPRAVAAPLAAGNTFVEVNPNTAEAGSRVNIRASCDDGNNRQANVQSDAFGRVMLRPDNGFLTGAVTIPGSKPPGTYGVNLTCQNNNTANTTLTVVNMSKPSQGPATGGGGTAGGGARPMVLAGGLAAIVVGVGVGLVARHRRTGMGS
jgi:hypothetical protein